MRFKDFYIIDKNKENICENIKKCTYKYIKNLINQQIISIGQKSQIILENNQFNVSNNHYHFHINTEIINQDIKLIIIFNDKKFESFIKAIYFKPNLIQNYLKNFEKEIKSIFSNIRKKAPLK